MLSLSFLLLLSTTVSGASAIAVDIQHYPRDTVVNGSCISAPDEACVSLVGLCVGSIATGTVSAPYTTILDAT